MRLAGIDIGTLTCRLLIAEVTGSGDLRELRSDRKILRLGEGLAESRKLGAPAMARVVETLKEWKRLIGQEQVHGQTVVATSAVREAANAGEFLRRVEVEVGWQVRVLTGQEEAQLTFLGIRHGLLQPVDKILGLDIGGGSTEFMFQSSQAPLIVQSVPLGVVTLTEELLSGDPVSADQLAGARERIRSHVESVCAKLGDVRNSELIGTAGAVTTMAAMVQKLATYERARVHNFRLSLDAVCALEREVVARTLEQRRQMPGLEQGRGDVIAAGVLILRGVMETFRFDSCLVSDYGLREGVVLDLAGRMDKR